MKPEGMRTYVKRQPDVQERAPLADYGPMPAREAVVWAAIVLICIAGTAALILWPQEAAPIERPIPVKDRVLHLVSGGRYGV